MLNLLRVTLFHRGWDEEQGVDIYEKREYQAHWYGHTVASPQAGGMQYSQEYKIRIPGDFPLSISIGDRIFKGSCDAASPPDGSVTISGYSDNRKGINPHWMVIAK